MHFLTIFKFTCTNVKNWRSIEIFVSISSPNDRIELASEIRPKAGKYVKFYNVIREKL